MKTTVIGAGVIGLACAYELSRQGHQVTIVDASTAGAAASAGNAGWVTPYLSSPRAAPGAVKEAFKNFTRPDSAARLKIPFDPGFASWCVRFLGATRRNRSESSRRNLQTFSRSSIAHFDRLQEDGVEFEHHRSGLAVAFQDLSSMEAFSEGIPQTRSLGYSGSISSYRGNEVQAFDASLSNSVLGVIHLEDERHVRPEDLCRGLVAAIARQGGTLIENDSVKQLESHIPNSWITRTDSGLEIESENIVIAAGFHSRDLLKPLGIRLPIEAAKGTSLTASGVGTVPEHALKLYEHMIACSPFDGSLRLSGTFDVGDRTTKVVANRLNLVVQNGLRYLKDWSPTEIQLEWSGHRPTSSDDLPIIGRVEQHPGLYVATGHGTLGVTLGPLTGALAAKEIITGHDEPTLQPFRLSRFSPNFR